MLVSVVICSYNSAHTLGAALDSVAAQTFPAEEFEVLLVDDGSTDDTPAVAARYAERLPNLRYVRLPENRGLATACNAGLGLARGKYFIRLDADDTVHPDILRACIAPLEEDRTDLAYCDRYEVSQADGSRTLVEVEPFSLFRLTATATMLRTEMVKRVGGYRPLFWEEYDLYMRYLARSGRPPVRVPRPLYYYSRHPGSMTANEARVRRGWAELRRAWGDDALRRWGWHEGLVPATAASGESVR